MSKNVCRCDHDCLVYTTPEGEYDVAAYALDCPVHGWRFDWKAGPLPLSEAEAIDRENKEVASS